MIVLLTGASGFLGARLTRVLLQAGHHVVCAVRRPPQAASDGVPVRYVAADFERDVTVADWMPRLAGVDAVINAAGILREHGRQSFARIHVQGPCALFAACAAAGVSRVVQISALGADEHAESDYHRSKKAADDYLLGLPLDSVAVVQPSLVYGPGGTSARLFTMLASLPVIGLPGRGAQQVQPIHVDDAVEAIAALLAQPQVCGRVPLVGPHPVSLRDFLATLRQALGLGRPRFLPVPAALVGLAARVGSHLPGSLLDQDTWRMLQRGNTGDAGPTAALLGRPPREVAQFVEPAAVPETRRTAQLAWLLPLARWSVALVWIVTGIVSLGLFPVQQSYELLARAGVPGPLAPLMLYGAALLDLALGIATLLMKRRRPLWRAQIALMGFYTVVITVRLPEFWLHPYGPILKNLPLLALLWLLYEMEER
ncbi:SDR family oxidoreductase [Aquabacterium sp. A7-Y]|uniref:SDR family oxidoreductase n=1 Tax=Aquabacterium sp. A7-Y TaxID=1349605 RepID=UPI00223E2233|nr:SDR family oxidoreductase [Aquabacterium sp. A7-Y]MCW7537394.1 SDR family oxidoreductase [Aquabacterium sp. A7-Y]